MSKNEEQTSSILNVNTVSKSYGKFKAINGIDLQINCGEFVALLGPNGAGKTTLFQMLTGLFVAENGSIIIRDYDIRHNAVDALAGIGVVFQQPTLDLDLSVIANLKFHTDLHGVDIKTANNRIHEELERLGLTDKINDPARSLSGGNKRKVELVRALLHQPQLLLMDEASIGLDPASRKSLVDYVRELCRERNIAVLWATHLVDEVEQANRIIIMNKGKILSDTNPEKLLEQTGEANINDAFLKLTNTQDVTEPKA